jgi:hypothetical protein
MINDDVEYAVGSAQLTPLLGVFFSHDNERYLWSNPSNLDMTNFEGGEGNQGKTWLILCLFYPRRGTKHRLYT